MAVENGAISLLLLGVSLAVRLIPARNALPDFDTYGHLYFAKAVKEQKAGPWGSIRPNWWGCTEFRHPFLWHWIVGLFRIPTVLHHQKWINGTLDALFAVYIYALLMALGSDATTAWLGMLLYLLTPMWFSRVSTGPRVVSLTPRLLSEIGVNLMFIVALLDIGLPHWARLLTGAALACVVVLSSKFGVQAVLFLAPLASVLAGSGAPFLAALGGMALAMVITRGAIVDILRGQLSHLVLYSRRNARGLMAISGRNKLRRLFSTNGGGRAGWKVVLSRAMALNSYTAVAIKMPVYLVALGLWLLALNRGVATTISPIMGPVLAATLIYLVINQPRLLFLGEAERYLNHVAVFIVAATTILAARLDYTWVLWLLVAYGGVYWMTEVVLFGRLASGHRQERGEADQAIETYLQKGRRSRLILSYPYHAVGVYRILLQTPHSVLFFPLMDDQLRDEYVGRYESEYPYVRLEELDGMADEIGVDTLIVSRAPAAARGLGDWLPPGRWKHVNIGRPFYDVYER